MSERLTFSRSFKEKEGCGELSYVKLDIAKTWEQKLSEIEDMLYDADGNEVISLNLFRELAAAERDKRLIIRPDCTQCASEAMHRSNAPCCYCWGRVYMGDRGDRFVQKKSGAALAGKGE